MRVRAGFLLALFLHLASAQYNPLKDPNICGRPTCKGSGKFQYQPGVRYQYKYYIDISSSFNGTSTNESTLHVQGSVNLDFISECDGLLSITDLKLSEKPDSYDAEEDIDIESPAHPQSELFAEELSYYPLRFSFNDGIISELCPYEEEKSWALNFKRGLLSMFHNTMKRFDLDYTATEDDVRGSCETKYAVQGAHDTSLAIEKIKELSTCESRAKVHSILQSTPYNFRSNYRGESLMRSTSKCQLSVDHHVYNEIRCEESHIFEPFSNKEAGAMTGVKQRLSLLSEMNETVSEQPPITRRTPLLYDHVPTPKPTSGELKISRDLLKKLCQLSTDDTQTEFSDLFTQFVHTARLLSDVALSSLYEQSSTICPTGKKHILDALPFLGSSPAVNLIKDIILSKGVSKSMAHEWILAVSFIPRPTVSMLEAVREVLESIHNDSSLTLGIAALTHTFCIQNHDCINIESVGQIIDILETEAGDAFRNRKDSRENDEKLIVSLKALANIGVISERFKEELYIMIEEDRLDVGIRVAAVQAFRRLPCEESRPRFEEIFRKQGDIEAEVRIAAYLQIMRCPNYLVIRAIKHSLQVEEVNQVGSFIWSHLHNLLKSSIPSRVVIQSLLSDKDLGKKFSSDVRKFSHNYEGSVFFEEYNVGANYESNVIFSPSSYIPRAAMLNFTVDLFGESINLLELDGRIEGFEHYLESIFGPKGEYNAKKLQDKIPKMRWPRSTSPDENLKSQIENLPYTLKNNLHQPKVSLGMKMFGNEIKYNTLNGEEEIRDALRTLNPIDHLKRILSGKEISYNKAVMFLDSSYVVPSGAGLPITLNAVGTASINMKLYGSLRTVDFMKTKELDLIGSFHPSAVVNIIGTMSADLYYASTGIKLKTNMYTSSAVEGAVTIKGSKLVSVKFNLPQENTEIFGVQSELIVVKGDAEEKQGGLIKDNRASQSTCSWPAIDKTIGLKLCAHYYFANVTKIHGAPYFPLAGPAGFLLSLQKADPTAKTYLLEYRWDKSESGSVIQIAFDTPGSSVRRFIGANFTLNTDTHNLTLLMQSAAGTILAKGKYKNTDDEKYLQIGLDVDNKKHLDTIIALERRESRNGQTYIPKFYLGVNGERVAELQGSLKWVTKKGISQCDVDLKFQTKRLTSKLFGYISKSDVSIGTNMKLDYKFVNTKEQRAVVEFTLANRSTRTLVAIHGDFKLETTAYPHFNFEAALKYQKGTGRMEYKLEINSSPELRNLQLADPNRLSILLVMTHKTTPGGIRLNAIASVTKPISDLDLRAEFSYEVVGPTTDFLLLARYAKEKNIAISVFWYHPRGSYEQYDCRLNVTLPSFTPMIVRAKLRERRASDYEVELAGTWFSGHSARARGVYQDKSSQMASNHHMKFLIKSTSFREIEIDGLFYRNNSEFKVDLKANHDNDDYGILLKHVVTSPVEVTTQARIKYRTVVYSLSNLLSLRQRKQIVLELHFDQYRDVHVALWGYDKEAQKGAGFEIKWDANRDPNQKLAATVEVSNPKFYNYEANFVVSYPGRTINGLFDFLLEDRHFSTITRLGWSSKDMIALRLTAELKTLPETLVVIIAELATPIEDWRKTSLNMGYRHGGNLYQLNGSIYWYHDQHVSIDLFGDFFSTGSELRCEYRGALVSTLPDVPSLSAALKHNHNTTRVGSILHIMYHPKQEISVESSWHIDQDSNMKNLTGTVQMSSPFENYRKGLLVSKIYVTKDRDLRGVADLDLDHRKFTASVEGHLKRLSKSMFVFNITTPIEKYKRVIGRLGFSEEQRHLVALVQYPTGTIGLEIKFLVESIGEFDVQFYIATPIEFLQEAIIVAKLKLDRADFRVGWNSLLAGFTGVWHYANITDLEYSYKIYTPIEGFEENGVVAKLILKEGLDLEVSVKLAENRLGVTVVGQPKPRILNELGIKTQAIYMEKLARELSGRTLDKEDLEGLHEEDPISWSGKVKIDPLMYPSIEGTLDVEQKGTLYVVLSELTLPNGKAQLKDEFDYVDVLTMKNSLQLTTPYQSYKTITSDYEILFDINKQYLLSADFNYLNNTQWMNTGVRAEYVFKGGEDEEITHNATFHVHTPFKRFPLLDLHTILEMEENVYRFNFALTTNSSNILVDASAEMDEGLIDANVATHLVTPHITLSPAKLNLKKDFTELENRIELHFDMLHNKPYVFNVIAVWKYNNITNFRVNLDIETPLRSLEKSEVGAMVSVSHNNNAVAELHLMLHPINVNANATIYNDELYSGLIFDFNGKRHDASWHCTLVEKQLGVKEIRGQLTMDHKAFVVNGMVQVHPGELPKGLKIQIEPQEGGAPFNFEYLLQSQTLGHVLSSKVGLGGKFIDFNANAVVKDLYNWNAHLKITTSHVKYKYFIVDAEAEQMAEKASVKLNAQTPLENLENPRIQLSTVQSGPQRNTKLFYELTKAKGSIESEWCWILMENMTIRLISKHETANYTRKAIIEAFYINSNMSFDALRIGAEANINDAWIAGSNLKLSIPTYQRIDLEAVVQLPKPTNEMHTVRGKLQTTENFHDIDYFANYRTKLSAKNYGSTGSISYLNGAYIIGNVGVEWGERRVNNYVEVGRKNNTLNFTYKLRTPKYEKQDAFSTNVTYTSGLPYHNLTWLLFQPANRSILQARVNFMEIANMNGTINVTTPFERFKYVGAHFAAATSGSVYNRYMQIFWPNNTALLDSKCAIKIGASPLIRDTVGVLLVEVPLATRHIARVDYSYTEKPRVSTGRATVDYNHEKVLVGKYNCLSEARAGLDRDTIHVELENKLVPVGAAYVHGYEYGAPGEDSSTVDSKRLEVYQLHNHTGFNVTGEMVVRKTFSGQEIALTAIHTNRTVKFWTDYDVLDQQFKQHSKLELGPNVWISYDLDLLNKTEDENSEAQEVHVTVSYPKRSFLLFGAYNMTNISFSSDASLLWDKKLRSVEASFDWRKDATRYNRQEMQLQFRHPSFEKNVSILGEYETTERKYLDARLTVDYSLDPEKRLKLNGVVEDNSDTGLSNYTYKVWGSHPATNLVLHARGGICWKSKWYYTYHVADYKRTYLPLQSGESTGRIDLRNNEVELKKKTLRELSYFWGRYAGGFPLYTANISAIQGNDIDATGEFFLNFSEKLVKLELNITEDGSQSMHAYGEIPDARSAIFDLWRDYEDIRVSDISYFLRLNHSRLIVSSLKWRPEIKQDIQNAIRTASVGLYNDIVENTDYWRHYIRSETANAIADIWADARPLIENFLDDLKDLKVVEQDFEELKTFLNTSYYDNEFYVRGFVGLVMYVIDELSIRSHIESLPAIVSEIWEVMGDSGKKIQKGIMWVTERIKTYYKNAAEFVNGLFQGDSLDHISEALKELLEKYDNFIKDMHVSFIRYVEQLWKQTSNMLLDNWHKTLAAIEPTFIKILHYLESVAWNASKEFLDFLYIRKNEIIESPYFSKLSNFTHDLDKFYHDMTGNETLWHVYKYTKVVWKFIKERFIKVIPFGQEVQAIISEIISELKELKNLHSIEYLTEKYLEMYSDAKWFYDYFDVGNRIHRFIGLVHLKLTDMTQTALQAENRYREAKTKFIFEPNDGIMYLEQKLPMSWHAFNESPKFQEIPEYKAINGIENYFVTSRTSFWNFYYDYKPYTDPSDWFPPFKAQAMIAGSQFYVTFDRAYYNFRGGCSYLLAADFLDRNFSLAISYSQSNSHLYELILLSNNSVVHIDLVSNRVNIEKRDSQHLPADVGDMHLYQESDVVTLDSASGFTLQCNLKFSVCMLELSGWYFGKTAGLWGTMNNEPSDDLLMADGHKAKSGDIADLANSWALDRKCSFEGNRAVATRNPSTDVQDLCKGLFQSKVSSFVTCFPRVPNVQFLNMCLNSTSVKDACSAVVAYISLCAVENTPLRIPASCVRCNLGNGTVVPEGKFIQFDGSSVPRSTDIVFIVEAKECNRNLKEKRSIDVLIEVLHKELAAFNITQNRYSVVVFGGNGVFDQPRSVVVNSNIFAPYYSFNAYFDNIPAGNGNSDIFQAIVFATKLVFRPAVSKTFILLPCTDCNESNMKLDYAMLHQLLVENDITLHILMNEEFRYPKSRISRMFLGVDQFYAYTRKDVQELKGNIELKKQTRISKSTLGFCTPLALETNGTVFSGRKLEDSKRNAVRKIATVFSKRVAQTAVPSDCQMCECTAPNTGISYMECFPCNYPTTTTIDYGFDDDDDDDTLPDLQPSEVDDFNDASE